MNLPDPPPQYNRSHQVRMIAQIERADRENQKQNRDIEVGAARLILTSPNGTRYSLAVANDGTVSASAV